MNQLDSVPLPVMFVAVLVLVLLCVECGFRLGRWVRGRATHEAEAMGGAMISATLGLLAFMLAFTFGMAESRYDRRRLAVLEEATLIESTYLRAQLLPDAQAAASAPLLREYVDLRVEAAQHPERMPSVVTRSEEIHALLWAQVRMLGAAYGNSELVALYIESLNDLIAMHLRRLSTALRVRIPTAVWGTLGLLTVISMMMVGYQNGLASPARARAGFILVLAFTIAMQLIIDLDRPQQGLVRVGQQAMLDVQRRLHATP